MVKKTRTPDRPQTAQLDVIERGIGRGDLDEAVDRFACRKAVFPDFIPLKRLMFDRAWAGGRVTHAAFAARERCEASPNITIANAEADRPLLVRLNAILHGCLERHR